MKADDYFFYLEILKGKKAKKTGLTISEILQASREQRNFVTSWNTIKTHLKELEERGEVVSHLQITGAKAVPAHFYQLKTKNI